MKDLVARRLLGIQMSGIRKMFDLAGEDSVNMGLGEPDVEPAPHIIEALHEAALRGDNGYGPSLGIPPLREAVAERISEHWKEDVAADNIIVTAGATQGLMAINQTFVDHGDEVLVPDPGFVLYSSQARICGGVPVYYNLRKDDDYRLDLDQIQERISPRTKLIVMNTPSNPTGICLTRDEVRAVAEIAHDADVMVVADEVYDTMTYDDEHHSFLSHMDNVVWVNSFSKTYAMTGWRLGVIATKLDYVRAIEKMHYYTVACPPTPIQHAGVAALRGPQEHVTETTQRFKDRRDLITKRLQNIPGMAIRKPDGAFYAMPSYDFDVKSEQLALDLAQAGLICAPGSAFGRHGEHHLRFSYACSLEDIDRGMDILRDHCVDLPLRNNLVAA